MATVKRKTSARQAQAIKTKNKIFKTAFDMMQKHGFDNITIEDISKKAGVSVGSFYYYFKSKQDILSEIFHRADVYFKEEVEGKFSSIDPALQIAEYFDHYAKYSISNNIDFTKQLYHTENKMFIRKDRELYQILLSIIKQGQGNGSLTLSMTAEELADFLFVVGRGLVFDWCLHDGSYDLEQAMTRCFHSLLPIIRS